MLKSRSIYLHLMARYKKKIHCHFLDKNVTQLCFVSELGRIFSKEQCKQQRLNDAVTFICRNGVQKMEK